MKSSEQSKANLKNMKRLPKEYNFANFLGKTRKERAKMQRKTPEPKRTAKTMMRYKKVTSCVTKEKDDLSQKPIK